MHPGLGPHVGANANRPVFPRGGSLLILIISAWPRPPYVDGDWRILREESARCALPDSMKWGAGRCSGRWLQRPSFSKKAADFRDSTTQNNSRKNSVMNSTR